MLYSKSTNGFYIKEVHGANTPVDAIGITVQDHAALMAGQARGWVIQSDDVGRPMLIEPPTPTIYQTTTVAREKRNRLVSDTDYMLMPDYPVAADRLEAVKVYRQALRDITAQPGFPTTINWPEL